MPRKGRGHRLWFQPARRDRNGYLDAGVWTIRDGPIKRRLGRGAGADKSALEAALAGYILAKIPRERDRHPDEIIIADVLDLCGGSCPRHQRPREVATRGLDQLNAKLCTAYG
jgi:hypothetical protein